MLTAALSACTQLLPPSGYAGNLYAATNSATGNAVVHYGRGADGKLTRLETTATGGNGTGSKVITDLTTDAVDPLFSNDSVFLSPDHTRLFAVNAASNTVSSFTVGAGGALTLVGSYASGGTLPNSLAVSGSLLYVGHGKAAGGVQITGFKIAADGSLSAIAGAKYAPSGETLGTQVLFSPDGKLLEFSELMTGKVTLFPVNTDGTLGTPVYNMGAAPGPFGAAFLGSKLFVSEVHPGAMNVGSVSSYTVAATGALTSITGNVSNGQNATCWLTLTPDGKYLYASNTSSSNVSVYSVVEGGGLKLVSASQAYRAPQGTKDFMGNPASGPVDAVVSADGKYFYQQFSGLGLVAAYSIGADGLLTPVANGDGSGLPLLGTEGLAGY
ncbi:lactonase family protein [Deinococcus sp.]|uniref:lactonase family protein n=1 Tax=Deinococcus sp. TaxID=47478 RepID=UPI003C7BEF1C